MDTNIKRLLKKNRAKYLSVRFSLALQEFNPHSPLKQNYTNTFFCARNLVADTDRRLKTKYCKNRWCFLCNRIRTAQLINGYHPQLLNLKDKHFVTLTAPIIASKFLKSRIKQFEDAWRQITDLYLKTKPFETFKGLRKMECTLRDNDLYHYHFHVIIEGKEQAEWLMGQWLKRISGAKKQAQDIRPADDGSCMELFKYFTKMINKDTSLFAEKHRTINAFTRLDFLFRTLRGKRVFQPFGGFKSVSETIDDKLERNIYLPEHIQGKYLTWYEHTWVSELGELLTNYKPSEEVEQLLTHCPKSYRSAEVQR